METTPFKSVRNRKRAGDRHSDLNRWFPFCIPMILSFHMVSDNFFTCNVLMKTNWISLTFSSECFLHFQPFGRGLLSRNILM